MHPVISGELVRVRHAELLRDAERERRIAAARRAHPVRSKGVRRRAGLALVRMGEALAGASSRPSAAMSGRRPSS